VLTITVQSYLIIWIATDRLPSRAVPEIEKLVEFLVGEFQHLKTSAGGT